MKNTVIFIPGIMGSSLGSLWSEDILASFKFLAENPGLLKLPARQRDPQTTEQSSSHHVLGEVRTGNLIWPICQRLREELSRQAGIGEINFLEFGYDWRQHLLKTSRLFGQWLSNHNATSKSATTTIIAHSMGCLVAALSIVEHHVDPALIKKLIFVGGPLRGAPAAFRALYSPGYLKGLEWIERLVQPRKNRIACITAMLDTFQSFPSLYQLLPPSEKTFVWRDGRVTNPINDGLLASWAREAATDVHSKLVNIEEVLLQAGIEVSLIYGVTPKLGLKFRLKEASESKQETLADTDEEYVTTTGRTAAFRETYTEVRVKTQTIGDGTVPAYSAAMSDNDLVDKYMVPGVRHSYMCQDNRVVELIKSLLPKAKARGA